MKLLSIVLLEALSGGRGEVSGCFDLFRADVFLAPQINVATTRFNIEIALDTFNTAVVSHIYYVMFTSLTILASVIMFKSGGEFDLKLSASSNDEDLYYDSTIVIICAIGSRYNSYCSNIARTFLIDANATQSKAYEVLLKAHEATIGSFALKKQMLDERRFSKMHLNLQRLLQVVREVHYSRNGVTLITEDSCVFKAKYVILSVSVGVLQSDLIQFSPCLPPFVQIHLMSDSRGRGPCG